jgi:non-specific serine/threonine protein kinase
LVSGVAPYHNKALPAGTLLREWRLEEVLGVGGFAIVYRGRGVYFDELVAIKEYFPGAISDRTDGATVSPTDSSSEELYALGLKKFVEEAKVLWTLSKPERHPNIVSVRSLFEIHGTAYMVMDFEDGVSLSQRLRDGARFTEAELLPMLRAIADGLDRAHRGGVIHRDIKPANILLDSGGRPVLIDFGSARFDAGQATSTKVTFYTPPYAALEQYVKTYPQGPWTDIYALGVVLHQCVTGEKAPDVLERMHGEAGEPLAARERPGFSRAFTRAVDAAMAARPADRPQSLPEWLALFDLADGDPVEAEATRVTIQAEPVTPPLPLAQATEGPPSPLAVAATPDFAKMTAKRPRRLWIGALAGVAAVALAGASAFLAWPTAHTAAPPPQIPARPTVTANRIASAAAPDLQPLAAAASGLLADAKRFGRPAKEIDALAGAQAQVDSLAVQAQAAAPAARAELVAQVDAAATDMARAEASALDRSAQSQAREVDRILGKGGRSSDGALLAVHKARTNLAAAASDASTANDPAAALGAARRALIANADFAVAYAAAARDFAPALQAEFAAIASAARADGAAVAKLAARPKPWLFAAQSRKQAYQKLQSDAGQAKAALAALDSLTNHAAASSGVKRLQADVARARSVRASLASLSAEASAVGQAGAKAPAR